MFCYQCEETINNKGCTTAGACGKKGDVANLQDLLIYLMKGISICNIEARKQGKNTEEADKFIMDNLFATITNANFDKKMSKSQTNENKTIRKNSKKLRSKKYLEIEAIIIPIPKCTFKCMKIHLFYLM